jgi:hypothetical protein
LSLATGGSMPHAGLVCNMSKRKELNTENTEDTEGTEKDGIIRTFLYTWAGIVPLR